MIDDHPGVPPEERFKAIGGGMTTSAEAKATGAVRGLYRLVSADGLHWRALPGRPLFTGYALDTQNVLVWLPADDELLAEGVDRSMWKGVSDAVLMTSRGGVRYERKFMESFVRPGATGRRAATFQHWASCRPAPPRCHST
jgi:hypothetical protein